MPGLLLSEREREQLVEYLKNINDQQARRGRLILLYDDGWLTYQAAEETGFSRSQARYWKHEFLLNRFSIFPGLTDNTSSRVSDEREPEGEQGPENPPLVEEKIEADIDHVVIYQLPFPEVLKRPGILPEDTLAEAGRKIWLFHFAEMLSHESATRLGEDIEGLHDMRVATRRMRAAYDVFGEAFKPKVLMKHMKGLKATGRALGRVRDLDVLIERLETYISHLGYQDQVNLMPLVDAWKQERENGRIALLNYLDSKEYARFVTDFNVFVQGPGEGTLTKKQDVITPILVCELAPYLIYLRFGSVRAFDAFLHTASDLQLHALRIEFKKLRYTIEYFKEVLGNAASQVISDLKVIQDHLGDFHDAVVACDLVTAFLAEWENNQITKPLTERQNPEQIVNYLAYLHSERHRLLVTFPEVWAMFSRSELRENLAKAIAVL